MKTILLVAETENERTRYLHHLLDGRYQMETAKDAAKAKEQLEERGSEISAVVIDDPYRFARADLVIDHIRTSNTYMLAIPVLILTDEENRSFDELFLCDVVAGLIRMGNWVQNDTFRAAGDSVYGTVMEIIFMWAAVIPFVWLSGMVWHWPTLLVFACCYIDEPV